MKNVGIYYYGGCGGHFLHHFLLTSCKFESTYQSKIKITLEDKDKMIEKIKYHFYFQFNGKNNWLDREMWPNNKINKNNQLFLFCDPMTENSKIKFDLDCIKICPYIPDTKDWFRTILFKKTNLFRNKDITFGSIRKNFQKIKNSPPKLKIPFCEYYVDIIEFVKNKEQRLKLCQYLGIDYNDTMEEFVLYYRKLHKSLKKTKWIDKPSK